VISRCHLQLLFSPFLPTSQHHDVRVRQHLLATLTGHEQEVCGLKWSHDGTQLASGSNDNVSLPLESALSLCSFMLLPGAQKCKIWDVSTTASNGVSASVVAEAKYTFTDSCAAVKALAWCPWQKNLLATGAGMCPRA
jgi:cell division cycle protein 20 (cofactor of APC complex)